MNTKKDQSAKGLQFEKLLKLSKYRKAEFATLLGKTTYPGQTVNNWILRGVPSNLALKAANMLGCSPYEISDVQGPEDNPKSIRIQTKKSELKADMSELIDTIEGEDKLSALDGALKSIRALLNQNP